MHVHMYVTVSYTHARVPFLINMNSTQSKCIATYTTSGKQNTVYISACVITNLYQNTPGVKK